MRNVERITSFKSELLDIFMSMEVDEHAERRRSAAQRNLRAAPCVKQGTGGR
mgnify:CR=1 FL=1